MDSKYFYYLEKDPCAPTDVQDQLEELDKDSWSALCANPYAIDLLKANPTKIDWWRLSTNPNAEELLKANLDKISIGWLASNPNPDIIKNILNHLKDTPRKSMFQN